MDTIITFGKYKDQPLINLIEDKGYLVWIIKQKWFRENHLNIYNIIITNVNIEIKNDFDDFNEFLNSKKILKIHKKLKCKFKREECTIFGNFIDYLLRYIICKKRKLVFYDNSCSLFYGKNNEYYESYLSIINNKDNFPKDIFKCSLLNLLRYNENFDISTVDEAKYCKHINLYTKRPNILYNYFKNASIILNYNLNNIIRAEPDLIIDDFIIDIKCYNDIDNLLSEKNLNQLIMYNYLAIKKNLYITKLAFYDFFRGELIYWNCDNEKIVQLTNNFANIVN